MIFVPPVMFVIPAAAFTWGVLKWGAGSLSSRSAPLTWRAPHANEQIDISVRDWTG